MINIHTFSRLCISFDLYHDQVALVVKNLPTNAGRYMRPGFDPWVGKIPWTGEPGRLQSIASHRIGHD